MTSDEQVLTHVKTVLRKRKKMSEKSEQEFKRKLALLIYQEHPDFDFDNAALSDAEKYAERFVKAVNAYDEMVTLLSEVRKWMDADEFGPWEAKLCERIDAALSKAGASQ